MDETLFCLDKASAGYGRKLIFQELDLILPAGEIIALCGPNGSGKSTALRSMRRLLPLQSGRIDLKGRDISAWSGRDLARAIAMLSQHPEAPEELPVRDLVQLGRYAYRTLMGSTTAEDRRACDHALHVTGMTELADTPLGSLSGGQVQRAWIAMVLAQDAPTIFLDEPINHLDIAHALDVLELIVHLNRNEGRSFVVVLHDLNLAARYADHIVLFNEGRVAAQGTVQQVFTRETISAHFGIECQLLWPDGMDRPIIVPHPRTTDGNAIAAAAE